MSRCFKIKNSVKENKCSNIWAVIVCRTVYILSSTKYWKYLQVEVRKTLEQLIYVPQWNFAVALLSIHWGFCVYDSILLCFAVLWLLNERKLNSYIFCFEVADANWKHSFQNGFHDLFSHELMFQYSLLSFAGMLLDKRVVFYRAGDEHRRR